MIKLLALDGDSSFSVDSRYRILSRMEFYGLYSENVFVHNDLDALIDEAVIDVDEGKDVIVAVEPSRYVEAKALLLGRLLLEETSSSDIAEAISVQLMSDYNEEPIDLPGQCLMPRHGKVFISNDGLYSGFGCIGPKGSSLFFLPLDYSRIDSVIDELVKKFYTPEEPQHTSDTSAEVHETDDELTPGVQNLVYSLVQLDKRVAFSDSEAMDYIKPLTDTVDGFGAVTYFVRSDTGNSNDAEKTQLITVRRAREALAKTNADFGAAVSDIIMSEDNVYAAFIAVYDGNKTTVKKITTNRAQNMDLILPKAVALLIDVLCQCADILHNVNAVVRPDDDDEKEKPAAVNMSMVIVASLVSLIAIICAIFFTAGFLKDEPTTSNNATAVINPVYSTTAPTSVPDDSTALLTSEPTTATPSITTPSSTPPLTTSNNTGANSMVTEPTAAQQTTQPVSVASSTSGTFTFYVFGYGHGVGLSQNGANAFAKQGWNYAEILANYYYGTTLVIGDTYPKTITYAGSKYQTREYLASALVSEMDESFELEALKAQVVALYTYAKYYNFEVSATGNAYGKTPGEKAYKAVDAVLGYYLTYNGDTALTPFHSTSAGKTTSYYNVWGGTELPYLAGGRPSYSDYEATDFQTAYSIKSEELKNLVDSRCNIELSGDPSTWISVISHDGCIDANTGYVYSVSVGGTMFTGYKFRNEVMDGVLRSHCFKILYTPDPA